MQQIADTRAEPDYYDDSERVAERIADMSYAELRDMCDSYRCRLGIRRQSDKFSTWLRDRVSDQLVREDRASFDP